MTKEFDPFSLGADPFPAFARARAQGGFLYGSPPFPGLETTVYLFTHRLVEGALKHPRLLHAPPGTYQAVRESMAGQHVLKVLTQSLLFADPPRHGIFRRPLAHAMTPAKGAALADSLRRDACSLASRLAQSGRFDAVQDLATPFAVGVLGGLLGMAMPDLRLLREATDAMIRGIDLRRTDGVGEECHALETYVADCLDSGNVESGGLVAVMLAEEAAGRWQHEDVIDNILLLMFAGQETIVDSLGNALMELDTAPAQRAWLDDGKVSWTTAAEELLRICAPIYYAGVRIAAEDLEIDGIAVRSGTAVVPVIASANRDAAVCPGGDQLRLDAPGAAVMTFGTGIHACLGRHLARVEMAALLEALFTAAPGWKLDRAAVRPRASLLFRGLMSAPVNIPARLQ